MNALMIERTQLLLALCGVATWRNAWELRLRDVHEAINDGTTLYKVTSCYSTKVICTDHPLRAIEQTLEILKPLYPEGLDITEFCSTVEVNIIDNFQL